MSMWAFKSINYDSIFTSIKKNLLWYLFLLQNLHSKTYLPKGVIRGCSDCSNCQKVNFYLLNFQFSVLVFYNLDVQVSTFPLTFAITMFGLSLLCWCSQLFVEQVSARWRPEDACTDILEEAPVFHPTEEVFFVNCNKWWQTCISFFMLSFLCFLYLLLNLELFWWCGFLKEFWILFNRSSKTRLSILQVYVQEQSHMESAV